VSDTGSAPRKMYDVDVICVGLFNLRGSDKYNSLFYSYAILLHDSAR